MTSALVFKPNPPLLSIGNKWGYVRPYVAVVAVAFVTLVAYLFGDSYQSEKFFTICGAVALIFLTFQELFVRAPSRTTAFLYGAQGGLIAGAVGFLTSWIGHKHYELPFNLSNEVMAWSGLAFALVLGGGTQILNRFTTHTMKEKT